MGFGFYESVAYVPTYYTPYFVPAPVYVVPPVVEETVVVTQPPVVYTEPYGTAAAPIVEGAAAATEVPAGVGPIETTGTLAEPQPEAAPQPQADQPPQAEPQPQPTSTDKAADGQQLYMMMYEGTKKFSAGAYEDAARMFLDVTLQDPNNVDASLAYAVARFATGDYAVSSVAIRRGISRIPEIVDSTFDIRLRYGKMDDLNSHVQALANFVQAHPDDADSTLVLGFVQHFIGERAAARETFGRLRELSPADGDLARVFLNAKALPAEPATAPGTKQPQSTPPSAPQPMGSQPTQGHSMSSQSMQEQAMGSPAPAPTDPASGASPQRKSVGDSYVEILE